MSDRPFYAHGAPVPFPDHANAGVRLEIASTVDSPMLVRPLRLDRQVDAAEQAVPLPRLPEQVLIVCGGWLRQLWRERGVTGAWLLYLDLRGGVWDTAFPRQQCSSDSQRFRLADERGPQLPWTMRLAGSIRSSTEHDESMLRAQVLPFDGVHLWLDPRRWLAVTAVHVVAGGEIHLIELERVIAVPQRGYEALEEGIWPMDS